MQSYFEIGLTAGMGKSAAQHDMIDMTAAGVGGLGIGTAIGANQIGNALSDSHRKLTHWSKILRSTVKEGEKTYQIGLEHLGKDAPELKRLMAAQDGATNLIRQNEAKAAKRLANSKMLKNVSKGGAAAAGVAGLYGIYRMLS